MDELIVMGHFEAGALEAAFDIEALVEFGAVENRLPASATSHNNTDE